MSNFRIVKNSAVLYLRLLITIVLGIFTTRIVINALGIDDYGIYGVVAGLITMFGFMNAAMSSSTQRYLSFDLGLKDSIKLQQTFTTSVNIHLLIGVVTFLLAEVIGLRAVNHLLDIPVDRIRAANTVFQFSLVTFFFGIIQVPYQAVTIAYERMNAYAYISIIDVLLKLIAAYLLTTATIDKLILYSQLLALISVVSFITYVSYVRIQCKEIKYLKYFDEKYYKEILSFSGWNLFGNIAAVARSQGINVLINIFFGVALNAAYGVSMMIQGVLTQFAASIQQAINPQIIKSYAQGELERTERLMHLSSKYSFFVMLLLIAPLYLNLDYVLDLWLGVIPDYSANFIRYLFVFILIEVLSNSLMIGLQATGKIKKYHITVGFIVFLNFPLTYLIYTVYKEPEMAFLVLICTSCISLYARLFFVKNQLGYSIINFTKKVLLHVVVILVLSFPLLYLNQVDGFTNLFKVFTDSIICSFYLMLTIYLFGLNKEERLFIKNTLRKILKNGSN
ncbi:TPA: lipopolysaccharide biosynthesis protein [Vibrio cholerae]